MSMGIEIILYVLLLMAALTLSITFINEDSLINNNRLIKNKTDIKRIELVLYIKEISNKEVKDIKNKIEKGNYENIYDIVDKYTVIHEKD